MINNQSRVAKYVSGFQSHLDQFFDLGYVSGFQSHLDQFLI